MKTITQKEFDDLYEKYSGTSKLDLFYTDLSNIKFPENAILSPYFSFNLKIS